MKLNRLFCFLAILALLSACGFHLQSKPELPPEMQRTRLEVQEPYSEFARRLETHLEQAGINVVVMGLILMLLYWVLMSVKADIDIKAEEYSRDIISESCTY